jgi:dTDP-4-amino-4,6-dideoxygalactose transaminase
MILVTKPFMPPYEEYQEYLRGIWEREYLTNDGPLVKELEKVLSKYLNVDKTLFTNNGTIALQIAIKALGLTGEIITTPFSYVATTSSIVWEGCTPVFVDIDPATLNIDSTKIEDAITENTTGILATHVYGNPCDIDLIELIASKHNLKVIYDAAHCFGTNFKGRSIFEFGDISTSSFHATKLFHTVEGGAIFSQNSQLMQSMRFMRNFGHNGPAKYSGVGINGKNSEIHAAMGLCNLKHMDEVLQMRKEQCQLYDELLEDNSSITGIDIHQDAEWNHAYYPVIFKSESILLETIASLNSQDIYPRRYFYPSLDSLEYVETAQVEVAKEVSKKVLCLPLYHDLSDKQIEEIARIINKI